ncbi:MAG TPA: hypothetical protein VIE46_10145 [Gemmatimonadales bacterium]
MPACSGKHETLLTSADSGSRDLRLAPTDSSTTLNDNPASPRRPDERGIGPLPASRSLAPGATIPAIMRETIHSRHDQVGETVTARVTTDVRDAGGRVVIPAGSTVEMTITELRPATSKSQADGQLALRVNGLMINGRMYPVSADVTRLHHQLRGRGVSAGEVEKVGVGTAVGAVLGRVLGGDTKGAVIGGAVGAAGGTAVAVQTASRDVVVPAGTPVTIALTGPLAVATS